MFVLGQRLTETMTSLKYQWLLQQNSSYTRLRPDCVLIVLLSCLTAIHKSNFLCIWRKKAIWILTFWLVHFDLRSNQGGSRSQQNTGTRNLLTSKGLCLNMLQWKKSLKRKTVGQQFSEGLENEGLLASPAELKATSERGNDLNFTASLNVMASGRESVYVRTVMCLKT